MEPLVYCAACLWRGTPADLFEAGSGRLVCPACEEDECREEKGLFSRGPVALFGIGAVARRLVRNASVAREPPETGGHPPTGGTAL